MTTPTTPYRTEIDALRQRKEGLETELAELRARTSELDALRAREAELAAELAGVEQRISSGAARRSLPMLDQIRVASPCNESWNDMIGDDRVRFCLSCEKNVFNLSAMRREDAEALLQSKTGNVCVRFYQRADGTVLTEDCPVGVRKKRRKQLAFALAGAGAMALAVTTLFGRNKCAVATSPQPVAVMGDVAEEPVTPPAAPTPVTTTSHEPHVMGSVSPIQRPPPPHRPVMGKPSIRR